MTDLSPLTDAELDAIALINEDADHRYGYLNHTVRRLLADVRLYKARCARDEQVHATPSA
jgi:hypothetical protein